MRRARRRPARQAGPAAGRLCASRRPQLLFPLAWLTVLIALLLTGCGQTSTSGAVSLPGGGAPPSATPIAPSGWATYTNTAYHYAIQYPANWPTSDTSPTADVVEVYNFNPTQVNDTEDIPPPPYNKYSVEAEADPDGLSPTDFYTLSRQADPSGPPSSSQTQQPATVAGRTALQVIQQPVQWSGGQITYPGVTYVVPDGKTILIVSELYSLGGQPSAIFAHMIGSLRFTK